MWSDQSEFFSDFWNYFNLTRSLSDSYTAFWFADEIVSVLSSSSINTCVSLYFSEAFNASLLVWSFIPVFV